LLVVGLTGCEALQRKFVRKKKKATERPTPVIAFVDYSQAMTPVERYRKHYLMFDYWNAELLDAFQRTPVSPKKIRLTSQEALNELQIMHGLLQDEAASGLQPLIESRDALNQQLQRSAHVASLREITFRDLERQTRQIHREFFWRDVEDHLKPDAAGP